MFTEETAGGQKPSAVSILNQTVNQPVQEKQEKRTANDVFLEYYPLTVRMCVADEDFRKAAVMHDSEAIKRACTEAVKQALAALSEKDPELAYFSKNIPRFAGRMRDSVYKSLYVNPHREYERAIRLIDGPKKKNRLPEQNYRVLEKLAPAILSGECS